MRRVFHRSKKWQALSRAVGSTTVEAVRAAGFDVVPDPTPNFSNHGLIVHVQGVDGFIDDNLARLSDRFALTTGY
jgi:hypothetical protein